jgi:DNA-binding response OmpR family regulator
MPLSGSSPRICVINDNPEFLELMADILDEDAGYQVTTFSGATTTVDEIAECQPDLIVVDLVLGGASGWEIVVLCRADTRLSDVPIIVCSADVTSLRDRQEEFERIGDIHVLAKPFGIQSLTQLVEDLVGRPAAASG